MTITYSECPYCDEETEVNFEGEEEGQEFEETCDKCGKDFLCNVEFDVRANCWRKSE